MADSDKITHDSLIEENVFKNAQDSATGLNKTLTETVSVLQSLIAGFKEFASVSGQKIKTSSGKTVKEVKDEQAAYDRLNATFKGYTATQKELIVAQEKLKIQNAQFRKDAKDIAKDQLGLTTEYQRQSKELTNLKNKYKELSLAGKGQTTVAKGLLEAITVQDEKLKALDKTTGQYFRNIGNYPGQISRVADGFKGLSALGIALAEVLGLDEETIRGLTEAHGVLRHGIMGTHEVMENFVGETEAEKEATEESTEALAEATLGQKVLTEATEASSTAMKVLKYAMLGLGIGALIALLAVLYSAWQENKRKQEEIAEINKELIKLAKELQEAQEKYSKALDEYAEDELQNLKKILEARMLLNGVTISGLKSIKDIEDRYIEEKQKQVAFEIQSNEDVTKSYKETLAARQEDAVKNLSFNGSGGDEAAYEINEKEILQLQVKIKDNETTNLKLLQQKNDLDAQKIVSEKKYEKEVSDIKMKAAEERLKAYEFNKNLREKEKEEIIKSNEDALKAYEESLKKEAELYQKLQEAKLLILETYEKRDERLGNGGKKDNDKIDADKIKIGREELNQVEENEKIKEDKILEAQRTLEEHKTALASEELIKRDEELLQQAIDDAIGSSERLLAAQEKFEELKTDIAKKAAEERSNNEIALQQQVLDGIKEGLDNRDALETKAAQNAATTAQTQIQVQATLAAQGKKNMLDFQLAQQAKALDDELKLKKQAQKRNEALQLAGIFLEFEKIYAKDGAGAASKALAQTLVAKGISSGFEAIFAEEGGVVGESAAKYTGQKHKSGKDVWALVEQKERILSVDDNRDFEFLGGMDLLKNPHKYMVSQVINDNSAVVARLESLEKTIKNSPQLTISEDAKGRLMLSTTVNGNTQHVVKASTPIVNTYKS